MISFAIKNSPEWFNLWAKAVRLERQYQHAADVLAVTDFKQTVRNVLEWHTLWQEELGMLADTCNMAEKKFFRNFCRNSEYIPTAPFELEMLALVFKMMERKIAKSFNAPKDTLTFIRLIASALKFYCSYSETAEMESKKLRQRYGIT